MFLVWKIQAMLKNINTKSVKNYIWLNPHRHTIKFYYKRFCTSKVQIHRKINSYVEKIQQ